MWYTQKRIVGLILEFFEQIMDLGDKYMAIVHNTTRKYGNAFFDDGYAHIFTILMSDTVLIYDYHVSWQNFYIS